MKLRSLVLILAVLMVLFLASCMQEDDNPISSQPTDGHTHSYTSTVVPPTCTEEGYTLMRCECGNEGKAERVKATGHKGTEWEVVSIPTCTDTGKEELYCTVCFQLFDERVIKAKNHSYTETVIAPTCSQEGYVKHMCQNCAHQYSDQYTPATNKHEEGDPRITKAPTCTEKGIRTYSCKYCNKSMRDENISVVECNYKAIPDKANDRTIYTCTMCGDSYTGEYISPEALAQSSAKEIYQNSKDAMLEISAIDKKGKSMTVGSGFFISADGYIATNYHVIKGAYSLSVVKYTGGSAIASVKVVAYSETLDVAILKIETSNEKYLEFSSTVVETGDTIYALGSTLGLTDTFTYGVVSNPNRIINGKECVQFTAPISGGNSGGPLLDTTGKVIGIVTMQMVDGQNINFAIKSSVVEGVNSQKLETPLDISQVYDANIKNNAFHILKYYIMNNKTTQIGDLYTLLEYDPQTENQYGRKYTYGYDSKEDRLYIQIELIVDNMSRLSITVDFDEDNDGKFFVDAYDYEYYQSTMIGYLDHTAKLYIMSTTELNQEYFDTVFSDVETKYAGTNAELKKMGLYVSYSSLVAKFAIMLNNSDTGLSAGSFDLSLPEYESINP